MWLIFNELEERKGMMSKAGKPFDAFIVKGMKKGFNDEPDTPYEKVIFDTSTVAVTEKGIYRDNLSLLQYFQKQAKPGDSFFIKSERDGKFWRWAHIEKVGDRAPKPTYEPLTDADVSAITNAKVSVQANVAASESNPWDD